PKGIARRLRSPRRGGRGSYQIAHHEDDRQHHERNQRRRVEQEHRAVVERRREPAQPARQEPEQDRPRPPVPQHHPQERDRDQRGERPPPQRRRPDPQDLPRTPPRAARALGLGVEERDRTPQDRPVPRPRLVRVLVVQPTVETEDLRVVAPQVRQRLERPPQHETGHLAATPAPRLEDPPPPGRHVRHQRHHDQLDERGHRLQPHRPRERRPDPRRPTGAVIPQQHHQPESGDIETARTLTPTHQTQADPRGPPPAVREERPMGRTVPRLDPLRQNPARPIPVVHQAGEPRQNPEHHEDVQQ